MREIVLDTETTGLDPFQGHRLIEIGCVELLNRIPSGQSFHYYVNPERDVPAEAHAIHGISTDQLKDKPLFAEIADELVAFIGDAPLVAHNAMFDLGFLNAELERAGKGLVPRERLVDTLLLARRRHPGASNRLDDPCDALWHRQFTAHQAWRIARCGDPGRSLPGPIGARQAQLGLVETSSPGAGMRRRVTGHPGAAAAAGAAPERGRRLAAHVAFVTSFGEHAMGGSI